jgi:hypothetical protein
VIGSGCVIAGHSVIESAHVGSGTYLGPQTELNCAILEGGTLLNMRHRARLRSLESFIAGNLETMRSATIKPSLGDRWLAYRLLRKWRKSLASDPALAPRVAALAQVVSGKLALFGVVDGRDYSAPEIPAEWRLQLRNGPAAALCYGDVMGAAPGSFDDALHTLFYLADASGRARELCLRWVHSRLQHS